MHSAEQRLELRWRTVVGALVLAIVVMMFTPIKAYASVWPGPDDGSGKYGHCNVGLYNNGGTNVIIEFSCQYTLGTSGAATTNVLQNNGSGIALYLGNLTCSGCSTFSNPKGNFGSGWSGTNTAGHAERDTTGVAKTDNNITSASFDDCRMVFSARGTNGIPSGDGNSANPCVIDSVSLNVAPGKVPLPFNYYPGSSAGPALDATSPAPTCSRTLTDTSAMTGSFTAATTAANVTTTWDWDWGDSTTHGTTATKNHTYGALSTMPTGGWTATVTATYTVVSGHLFSDSTTVKTATCSLRVDFLHPDKSAVGSNDTSSTGDSGLDACLPSGWSALNPLAWVGSIGCILKYLFIPSESTITDLGSMWDTATTKLPFSIVYDVVTYIPDQLDDFQYAINISSPITGSGSSASFFCQGSWGDYFCDGHDTPFYGTDFGGGTGGHTVPAAITVTRDIMLFLIILTFVYSCWRGAGEILK